MKRKIYLEGNLGDTFCKELDADVSSVKEALKLVGANYPTFKHYIIDCHKKDIGFVIDVAGKTVEEEDLVSVLEEGDITITTLPLGSKSGTAKILTAIIIAVIVITNPQLFAVAAPGATAAPTSFALGVNGWGMALAGFSLQLGMAGIQQLMAPDPSIDEQSPQSYLFNGSEQNIIEGDPVPVLYGELRVPGRPISFSIAGSSNIFYSNAVSAIGQTPGTTTIITKNNDLESGKPAKEVD